MMNRWIILRHLNSPELWLQLKQQFKFAVDRYLSQPASSPEPEPPVFAVTGPVKYRGLEVSFVRRSIQSIPFDGSSQYNVLVLMQIKTRPGVCTSTKVVDEEYLRTKARLCIPIPSSHSGKTSEPRSPTSSESKHLIQSFQKPASRFIMPPQTKRDCELMQRLLDHVRCDEWRMSRCGEAHESCKGPFAPCF
jgi:hypothetical protein